MHILIVEDENAVRQYLQDALSPQGYSIATCSALDELETKLHQNDCAEPDLIILDRLLHGLDSSSMLISLKKRWPRSAILILSAIGGPSEKGKLLDAGADDYLSKPFSIEELSARVRVLLRRHEVLPEKGLVLGNTRVNFQTQTIEVENKKIELSRKEFLVLTTLMQNPSRVYNRYQLLDSAWDINTDVESNVVEVTIKNIRKKLESSGASIRIISKRNVGYWIEA